ncbi:F-box/RNI/FBD-like domain protein, putative [Medicago truncatula]|uniref:F-box/RNI/FBD-like domain protein, putative n=1 Tax=Medicago truncatula TaxID=3880 RepID=G7IWB9_MEDTR|nr:F-box/RNI/FBD-like domain protein, putative [Medicago truncatula]
MKDRLSDLPDCVLLRILSSLHTKQAVQTCVLSTRYNNLWKHVPVLSLGPCLFKTRKGFTKFVSRFLSLHDESTALRRLSLDRDGIIVPPLLERILNYVVSHNVKRLRIHVKCDIQHFPSCLFSCHTLTSLRFYVSTRIYNKPNILFPNSLNLPSLTRLHIGSVSFLGGADPFSGFPMLKSLRISCSKILGEQNLCISSITLVKLTINRTYYKLPNFNQKIELSTPSLCSFVFVGTPFQILSWSQLRSIKHVEIYAYMLQNFAQIPSNLLGWLLELTDIKSLKISSDTLQVLSLVPDLLKVKFHSLRNLKSLTVEMKQLSYCFSNALIDSKLALNPAMSQKEVATLREAFKKRSSSIPEGIIDFLLQNSPSAQVNYSKVHRRFLAEINLSP